MTEKIRYQVGLKLKSGKAAPIDEIIIVEAEDFGDARWKAREELISRYDFPSYGKLREAEKAQFHNQRR